MKKTFLLLLAFVFITQSYGQRNRDNERAAQIFGLGVLIGVAEYGASLDNNYKFIAEKLQFCIDHAEMTECVDPEPIIKLKQKLLRVKSSKALHPEIQNYRKNVLFNEILRGCSCEVDDGCGEGHKKIAGKWQTNYGVLTLHIQGNKVWGTYTFKDGRVEGTIEGNVMKGKWTQSNGSGELTMTFSKNCKKFTTRYWAPESKKYFTDWSGTKIKKHN